MNAAIKTWSARSLPYHLYGCMLAFCLSFPYSLPIFLSVLPPT